MKNRFASKLPAWLVAIALISDAFVAPAGIATAATAPGTQITNNATATYKDAASNSYNTTSNTVTTVVQNAPTLTFTAATGTAYSPGQIVVDTFTLTNTGNAGGTFQINGNNTVNGSGAFSSAADATLGGSDSGSATLGFGPTASGCSGAGASIYVITIPGPVTVNCDTLAHANTYLASQTIAAGAVVTVSVNYKVSTGATAPGTVTSSLYANINYAAVTAGGGLAAAPTETSAVTAIATESNTVIADANINQYKAAAQCVSGSTCASQSLPANDVVGDIQYTISANNSGSQPTKDLQSVKALLGAAFPAGGGSGGVMIMDKVPTCLTCTGTPVLALSNATGGNATVSVTVSSANGFATSAAAYVVYSTSATAATWALATGSGVTSGTGTFTVPTASSVYYLGVVMVKGTTGGACATAGEICPGTATLNGTSGGATGVDNHAAISYVFSVAQSTLPGSGNTGAYKNATVAAWGDNQPTEHQDCPGIAGGTADAASATQLTTGTQCINTPVVTNCPEIGCSNVQINTSLSAYSVINGPYDSAETGACQFAAGVSDCEGADATGTYDGSATNNNTNDFTAIPFQTSTDNAVNTGTTLGTPVTATTTSGAFTSTCIEHSVFNSGNKNDTFNLVAGSVTKSSIPTTGAGSATTGWTVTLYSDNLCASSTSSIAVNSGVVAHYYVKYTATSGQPYFDRFDDIITATSVGNGSMNNTTHDELYSGFIAFTKAALASTTNCPTAFAALAGSSATLTCPGGTLSYSMDYRNLVMGAASTNASFVQCITPVGSLIMTDDGSQTAASSATVPNWATFTTGLQTAPVDVTSNAVARTANGFTYASGVPAGVYSSSFAAGSSAFKDVVGGASFQLAPKGYFNSGIAGNPTLPVAAAAAIDWQGTITFSLTVK